MSNVLFLNIPAHGHVNPTLGLVHELIEQGEEVTYFCTEDFRDKIEQTGARFKGYDGEAIPFNRKGNRPQDAGINHMLDYINEMLGSSEKIIEDVLSQIKDQSFDYIMYASMYPFGRVIAQILKLPSVSSFAVFATQKELMAQNKEFRDMRSINSHPVMDTYTKTAKRLNEIYNQSFDFPEHVMGLFANKGDINIAYTSKAFIAHPEYYDDSFKFIGPPIYDRQEKLDFPFEQLQGKEVIYISMGTVFNTDTGLYELFFKTFADRDAVVVMTAYEVDLSEFAIPDNFIVRNFVPQSEILKFTDVAITHAGMNSTNDLLYHNVPFVAIPISADQPYMAGRSAELGAAISLNKDELTPELLKDSVEKVLRDPSYMENIKKISDSFKQSGGYKQAVKEIFQLKSERGILV